jgi:L-lysine exporter family protein LysE/ArgO
MLGHPVAAITKGLSDLRCASGSDQSISRCLAGADSREIENGKMREGHQENNTRAVNSFPLFDFAMTCRRLVAVQVLVAVGSGFLFALSLIVAIGPQNAFVLRQGLIQHRVFAVVAVCAVSDALLITLGVTGMGFVLERIPWLITALKFGGAVFLTGYGIKAARRALGRHVLAVDSDGKEPSLRATLATCLAFTWLNPHVYLDTLVLLGSVANSHDDHRSAFAVGAICASFGWFATLGYGARLLRPLFVNPLAWHVLDGAVAVIMFAIAATLVFGM